ncbi:unnamed protein product [Adineta steineri]|uniref:Bridge-like lipid transfer protein family member 1 C-terminal domain-containing protein n=1 Tax=Adineta steineri TaxID=433720 RepID=A0A814UK95_9BILA|nr:unnamed protein product [Adineta steineri]CAF1202690.1 unnamed protein product [Adineta steineri]
MFNNFFPKIHNKHLQYQQKHTDNELIHTNLNHTIEESHTPIPLRQTTTTKKRLGTRRKDSINHNINSHPLQTQQNLSTSSKRPILEAHITVHCQGMIFSTTLLSTLKAQYKIDVANIGGMKSRYTTIIHKHVLHFLNNNNHDHQQPPTISSDNYVRVDFPEVHCRLNLYTKIDVLKLTITADFLAQLVFVSKVIIHETNEIIEKVSGFDQFHFGATKHTRLSSSSTVPIMRIGSTDTENENEDEDDDDDEPEKDQQTTPPTLFTYKIDISMKGFEVMGQTPSNTIVKFENGDKKVPIFVKLTNYDEKNSLLLYNKPLINALLNIKLSLGQLLHTGSFQDAAYFETKLLLKNSLQSDDPDKEAYFIRLTKPSFYWQPGAIDKDIAISLQQYNPPTKLTTTDNLTSSGIITQESIPILDKTTISACSCGAIISSSSFEGFRFRFAENFQQTNKNWKPARSLSSPNIILNACCVPSGQYLMHSRAKHILNSRSPKWFLNVQWDMKGIDINLDSIIGKRFSQLIRTITSTQLIEPINHSNDENNSSSNSNLLNAQAGSTKNILENIDESEDDERIKRLEYEHLILGQKIETLKRSQTSYETLKPELARYEWLEKELLHTVKSEISQIMKKQSNKSGHNRDRNRIDSRSHKRTQSHDPSRPSHHTHSEKGERPSSIHEDETENGTTRASNISIRFPLQDPSMFDDHQLITTNTLNEITFAPAIDLELNFQVQIASDSCNLYTCRDLISNSSFTTINSTKQ